MTESRALTFVRATGSAVFVLALILFAVMPKEPVHANVPGFNSVVVGFELASAPQHVFGILGSPADPSRDATVQAMDLTNRIDFLFMIAYPALFAAIACLLVARGHAPRLFVLVVTTLAVVMGIADALENRQLLALSHITDATRMSEPLRLLRTYTSLKWIAIFVTSGLVAAFIRRDVSWWRWSAPVFGLSGALALLALKNVSWLEPAANVLAVGWLMTWMHAIFFSFSRANA